MAGQSLENHPVNVIAACQRLHNRFAPSCLQISAPASARLRAVGSKGCRLPARSPPYPPVTRRTQRGAHPLSLLRKKCCAI